MPLGPTAALTMRIDELAHRVSAESDARGVYEALHEYVAAATPMTGFFIAQHDEATKLRTCVYAFSDGIEVDAATLPPLPLNGSPNSRAIETRQPVLVEDYARATAGRPVHYIAVEVNPTPPTSALAVPMLAHDRVVGLLTIQSPSRHAFGAHEVEVLQSAANLAALALENLALREGLEDLVNARTTALAEANDELRRHAVARDLVRHMLGRLSQQVDVRPTTLREIGRDVAASLGADSIASYAAAYAQMGLGRIELATTADGRHEFLGHDLLERVSFAQQPTCYLALGFLEGAVGQVEARAALGTEVACQSRGHAACRFVVGRRVDG